ncbi:MAG: Rrf2 family transcriptional regulator [Clostridia bacterium]|nr:Rrf2 family transcriptional regulator [Clostridia bacterium]
MMVSTRGKYALQFMIDLAENGKDGCVPLKEIAERQQISVKYLERILPVLVKSDLIRGIQGKEGGYRLTREPAAYRVGEILRLTEGDLAPVSCLEQGAPPCAKTAECRTRPLWNGLNAVINEYLDKVTIADLMQ